MGGRTSSIVALVLSAALAPLSGCGNDDDHRPQPTPTNVPTATASAPPSATASATAPSSATPTAPPTDTPTAPPTDTATPPLTAPDTATPTPTATPAIARPNVVLILADDLGWNDVSYHGSDIQTPNIDRLAAEGLELDRFLTAPSCSPTRMGLLTGRYPVRWGMMDSAIRPWEPLGLPPAETTLPELLAEAGYATRVLIGKWHAGHAERRYHPLEHGFTAFFGFYNGAVEYFSPQIFGQPDWHRDLEPVDVTGAHTTDLITDEAIRVIRAAAGEPSPFLLSINYNAPHSPLAAPAACRERVDVAGEPRRLYAAVVTCLDDAIGRVLAAIDEAGLGDDTLVWFLSDNGGHEVFGADNGALRGEKLQVYEGGIRVPSALRWPAGLSGQRQVTAPIAYVDILPTLARIAGVSDKLPATLDGIDVLDVLRGDAPSADHELFTFQGPSLVTGPEAPEATALTRGPWKLIRTGPSLLTHPDVPGTIELYAIEDDPYETRNLAADHSDVVAELLTRIRVLRALHPPDVELSPLVPPPGWQPPLQWRIPDS